jgi:hypothetical protein
MTMLMMGKLIQIYLKMNKEMMLLLIDRFVRNLKKFTIINIKKNKILSLTIRISSIN